MHCRPSFALALVTALVWGEPAAASSGNTRFPDVPAGHWANSAILEVAVEHHLLAAFEDGTFRGDAILTRVELAKALASFIKELEASKGSLEDSAFSFYSFEDLEDPLERQMVEPLACHYNLFERVPGIEVRRFEAHHPVTRYEFALVLSKLLDLLEAKGLIEPARAAELENPFSDLSPIDFAYQAVLNTVVRYQVLSGFPDATFQGNLVLTRYQFAAMAAQAFGLIRERTSGVIRQRLPEIEDDALTANTFRSRSPQSMGLGALYTFNLANVTSPVVPAPGQLAGALGAALVRLRSVTYGSGPDRKFGGIPNGFGDWELDFFGEVPPTAATYPLVGGRDTGALGLLTARHGIGYQEPRPLQVQGYWGWLGMPDLAIGLGRGPLGSANGDFQIGAGGGVMAGGFLYHRLLDGLAYYASTEVGPVVYAGYRRFGGSATTTLSTDTNTPSQSTLMAFQVDTAGGQNVFPFLLRPYFRMSLGCDFLSTSGSSSNVELMLLALPGGLHDDAVGSSALISHLVALAAGLSVGASW